MIHRVPGGGDLELGYVWFVVESVRGKVKCITCSEGGYASFEACFIAAQAYLCSLTDIPDCASRDIRIMKLQ